MHALLSVHSTVFATNWQPFVGSQVSVVHGLPSSHVTAAPGTQAPPAHASPLVHRLPSWQATVLLALLQPPCGSHVSVVHGLPSSQAEGALGVHTPFLHASPVVQELLSVQAAVLLVNLQPRSGSQLSSVHGLPSAHASNCPPTQLPPLHLSNVVHTLPSSQGPVPAT